MSQPRRSSNRARYMPDPHVTPARPASQGYAAPTQRRAVYPYDDPAPADPPAFDSASPYVAYARGDRAEGAPARVRYAPPQDEPAPFEPTWLDDSDDGAPPPRRHNVLWATVIFVCVLLLAGAGTLIASAYSAYDGYIAKRFRNAGQEILSGVYVDSVHVGGMTVSEARALLNQTSANAQSALSLTVEAAGYTFYIDGEDVPLTRNLDVTLNEAYTIGRMGIAGIAASGVTPFEYRSQLRDYVESKHAYLYTQVTYDRDAVVRCVEQIAAYINRDAVSAQVATFDIASRQFTFTDESAGLRLNGDQLLADILSCLDAHQYSGTVTAHVETVTPEVTKAELRNNFTKIGEYSTKTTSNANRNTNIRLAANAINGVVVQPGQTFSFNGTVGERTSGKGYLPAAAIAGGTTVDEIGGGICQVSSTLFNAAALAGLELVSRSPHAWPSTYVDMGRDATVNWPGLDFKFKNTRSAPVFIISWYENRNVYVEIYGMSLGAGITVALETKLISTTEPPSEPLYQFSASLPYGETKELKKRRTGYVVATYRVYMRGGVEYAREKLCTSTYKAIQQVIEYNW